MSVLETDARIGDGEHRYSAHNVSQLGCRSLQVFGACRQRVEQLSHLNRGTSWCSNVLNSFNAVVLNQHARSVLGIRFAGSKPYPRYGGD